MNPVSHLLIGWCIASAPEELETRERTAIAVSSLIPDLDGFGYFPELLTQSWGNQRLTWYYDYHHFLFHNPFTAVVLAILVYFWAKNKAKTATLVFTVMMVHLLCDVIGARGPDGYQWPIYALSPFSDIYLWTWEYQWELNSWQNYVISLSALGLTFYWAWKKGISPLIILSKKADKVFVDTLRNRFGMPAGVEPSTIVLADDDKNAN